jgi:hypothetical protein
MPKPKWICRRVFRRISGIGSLRSISAQRGRRCFADRPDEGVILLGLSLVEILKDGVFRQDTLVYSSEIRGNSDVRTVVRSNAAVSEFYHVLRKVPVRCTRIPLSAVQAVIGSGFLKNDIAPKVM